MKEIPGPRPATPEEVDNARRGLDGDPDALLAIMNQGLTVVDSYGDEDGETSGSVYPPTED